VRGGFYVNVGNAGLYICDINMSISDNSAGGGFRALVMHILSFSTLEIWKHCLVADGKLKTNLLSSVNI
jgi:hypothetical protein